MQPEEIETGEVIDLAVRLEGHIPSDQALRSFVRHLNTERRKNVVRRALREALVGR